MLMARWLEEVAGRQRSPDLGEAEQAAEILATASGELAGRLGGIPGIPWPLSVTDSRVGDLGRCQTFAVARVGVADAAAGFAALAGNALDAFVTHVLFEGPVADAVSDLESMWRADGHESRVAEMHDLLGDPDPAVGAERRQRLESLARAAGTFRVDSGRVDSGRVDTAWTPRVEVKVGCTLDGVLSLRGRVDVMLGGPGTAAPAVLIEVKSGQPRSEHHEQLRHYMLLCALRHGEMPAAGAIWYAGGGDGGGSVTEVHVPGSALSAARRVAASTAALADFWEGVAPSRSPGPQCRWCPVRSDCPDAEAGSDAEDRADRWAGGW